MIRFFKGEGQALALEFGREGFADLRGFPQIFDGSGVN